MSVKKTIAPLLLVVTGVLFLCGCGCKCGCSCGSRCRCASSGVPCGDACSCVKDTVTPPVKETPTTYNIIVDNSGSMRGFFTCADLKTLLQEYYSGMKVLCAGRDTITLNFINTSATGTTYYPLSDDIGTFLRTAVQKMNASYSDIGDMLSVAMSNADAHTVNLMVSDYGFTSPHGQLLGVAQAKITEQFALRLKERSIAIAVAKYSCAFNGMFYPGSIPCSHDLPIYIWMFGDAAAVRALTRLPIKESAEWLLLQSPQTLSPQYEVGPRMLDKKDNTIIVSRWKKERRGDTYLLSFTVDMSSLLLSSAVLGDPSLYVLSDAGYHLDSIEALSGDRYRFTLSTSHPSPTTLTLRMPYTLPSWVPAASYAGEGVPPAGQTQNVLYLLEGVYDAYHNATADAFTISLTFK